MYQREYLQVVRRIRDRLSLGQNFVALDRLPYLTVA